MKSCLSRKAGSGNVLDTLGDVIIGNHLSATRRFRNVLEPSMRLYEVLQGSVRFHGIPWDSMRFRGIPWSSMRFYDVLVNRSVLTEANRGLTSYMFTLLLDEAVHPGLAHAVGVKSERRDFVSSLLLEAVLSL
jgi:hypothetical protein